MEDTLTLIPTPIECAQPGRILPGFAHRALVLTEPWGLMAWELYGNPDQAEVRLELDVRVGGYGQFPDRLHTVMRPTIWQGNKARFPVDGTADVLQDWPAGLWVGIWIVESNTDYFLLNLLRRGPTRPQIVQFQPPQRVPLPGEGETQSC